MVNKKVLIITGATVTFVGVVAISSLFLTAPGVNGLKTDISFQTVGSAEQKLNEALFNHEITVGGESYTAGELGVTYNSELLEKELQSSRLWNVTKWNKTLNVPLEVNEEKLKEALSASQTEYKDPINATVSFSGESWVFTPDEIGNTLSHETLTTAISSFEKSIDLEELQADVLTPQAEELTVKLNELAGVAKIVDSNSENNARPLSPQEFASFITVEPDLTIKTNKENIQAIVNELPNVMNKEVKDGVAVVDENKTRIHTLEAWQDGYKLGDISGLIDSISNDVESLSTSVFKVEGEVTKADVEELFRRVEVDLAARRVYTYENEKLVKEYLVAIGASATPTFKGSFHVRAQVTMQNMGCFPGASYCTKDVKWVSYFNGDQGFHGTYWHNDFGNPNSSARSHGCINMTEAEAYEMYKFVQNGTPVLVR